MSTVTKQAERPSMHGWAGLHVGMVSCHRDKKRHAQWRWGRKKGLRRARRRVGRDLIRHELAEVYRRDEKIVGDIAPAV
jgi:hypothetical protein